VAEELAKDQEDAMHTMRRAMIVAITAILVGAVLVPSSPSGSLRAQQDPLQGPANPSPLYVATFIDLMPPGLDAGTAAIKQYVRDTRKEPGIKRCEAVAQIDGRANHLMLLEVWQDEAAFRKHEAAAHTRDFRTKMQPLIGAPFDEREHFLVE
jgi:quinol monooxygenase YgiN